MLGFPNLLEYVECTEMPLSVPETLGVQEFVKEKLVGTFTAMRPTKEQRPRPGTHMRQTTRLCGFNPL